MQLTKSKGHLAHHPVVATVYADAPDDEANCRKHCGGIR